MHVTLAICTWNRADLLDITLDSLLDLAVPPGVTWEVIVADNNSTDHTAEVVESYRTKLPVTRLFTEAQGKSHAMNDVTAQLRGDLVIWLDDDVQVDSNLLTAYVEAARSTPEAQFFGGWIVPKFLAPEPHWVRPAWEKISSIWAARELGHAPFFFDHNVLPFGANMAVRVDHQKRYRYDPELGRCGELLLAGEETALMQQWVAEGHQGVWVPGAKVDHLMTPDRTQLSYVRRFFFSLAQSKLPRGPWTLLPAKLIKAVWYGLRAMKYEAKALVRSAEKHPERWIKYHSRSCYNWGRLAAYWAPLPNWLLPSPVKKLQANRNQPRYGRLASEELERMRETRKQRQAGSVKAAEYTHNTSLQRSRSRSHSASVVQA